MAAYDEIYSIIHSQEGSEPTIANRVFQWIYHAQTEIHVDFLVQAVCQESFSEKPKQPDFDDQFLLRSCQNLVIIDHRRICRFSHLSVREYLEHQHQDLLSQAHEVIAGVCLQYLSHRYAEEITLETSSQSAENIEYELLEYARNYWPYHCRIAMENAKTNKCITAVMRFLGSMTEVGPAYRRYCQTVINAYIAKGNTNFRLSFIDWDKALRQGSVLISVCCFGFYQILKQLLETSPDFKQRIAEEDELLLHAVLSGCDNIVRLLLEEGLDVNVKDGRYGSVLAAAASSRNESIIKILLESGADINAQLPGEYGSALVAASRQNESIVKLLLENGADINAQLPGGYGSALVAAVVAAGRWGNKSIVKLLLENGADVNAKVKNYGSALAVAARWGNRSIVKLLLDKGADVNAKVRRYGSVLVAAVAGVPWGDESILQLLLDKGADINAQLPGTYGSALAVAVFNTRDPAVELLLSYKADVKPLSVEFYNRGLFYNGLGYVKASTVQLLLENGLEVDSSEGLLPSVFAIFAMYGEEAKIEKLWTGYKNYIQILDKQGRNLLHFAARGGKWKTFETLQALGLDPMTKDVLGSSILHQAASGGDLKGLIKLPKDDLVELSKSKHWSPLHWACRAGKVEAVEQLLKLGIRSSGVKTLSPKRTWSPYSIAVYFCTWESLSIAESIDESTLRLDDEGEEPQILSAESQNAFCDGCFHVSLFAGFSFQIISNWSSGFMDLDISAANVRILTIASCASRCLNRHIRVTNSNALKHILESLQFQSFHLH
jgi:ankyrin repeat protein